MKTKEEFMAAKHQYERREIHRALVMAGFVLFLAAMRFLPWPRGTFSWLPMWGGVILFVVAPFVIIHLLIGGHAMRADARRCGFVCENCGKPLYGAGRKMRNAAKDNRCPFCGLPLYLA